MPAPDYNIFLMQGITPVVDRYSFIKKFIPILYSIENKITRSVWHREKNSRLTLHIMVKCHLYVSHVMFSNFFIFSMDTNAFTLQRLQHQGEKFVLLRISTLLSIKRTKFSII